MRIAVLGTGALGCVFAARLAPVAEVWMVGTWAEGIAAVLRDGVCLRERDGARRCVAVRAASDPAVVPRADAALLLVKSYQTERAAAWAARLLKPRGLAVTLQNGLDNGPKLAAAVGAGRCAVGATYNGAILLGPGDVQHTACGPTLIGVTDTTERRAAALAGLLNSAGLETGLTHEVDAMLWAKALANVAINPLTAIWRVPNGALLDTAERRDLVAVLADEAAAVARGKGIRLPYADPAGHVVDVCRATAANRSSMLQDVERGRSTEIDSLNGVIVREGQRLGVPTPVNQVVWRLVRGLPLSRSEPCMS